MNYGLLTFAIMVHGCLTGSCTKKTDNVAETVLTVPDNLQAVPGHNTVALSWTAVPNAGGYRVEVSEQSSFASLTTVSDTITETGYSVSELTPQTVYFARVRAVSLYNPALSSTVSPVSFTTLASPTVDQEVAFPGAEGFGRMVTGGRGGKVIYVSKLADDGSEGTFRHAVNQSGARTIVFSVSGNIELRSRLDIRNGNLTIAGQTAPGDGVCIKDYPVVIQADNIIIRYMRFRLGDRYDVEADGLEGRFVKNIMIDHCSISWSTDECASFYANENFTMQWCIISESLRLSSHAKGAHGYGAIWGGKFASFHHNLLAHHDSRNPRFGEEAGKAFALTDRVDCRNNVVYNWNGNSAYGGEAMNINIVNNYYKPGPATGSSRRERIYSPDKNKNVGTEVYDIWGKFYIDGNFVEGSSRTFNDNWTYGVYNQFHSSYGSVPEGDKQAMRLAAPHSIENNVYTHTAQKAFSLVLDYAGASYKRDAVDARVVGTVKNGGFTATGSNGSVNGIIDKPSDVGGYPELKTAAPLTDNDNDGMPDSWETANGLNAASPNAGGYDLSPVFTNLEVYMNSLVAEITASQKGG